MSLVERALAAWAAAPQDRASPFRLLQLATVAPDGAPAARTLVLRDFDRAASVACFHIDRRSAKAAEIAGESRVALLGWDPGAQLQIRARGTAAIHAGDAVARAAWDTLSPAARNAYALAARPGAPVTEAEAEAEARIDEAAAFAQFAVLRVQVAAFDILELGPRGAQFRILAERTPGGFTVRRVGP